MSNCKLSFSLVIFISFLSISSLQAQKYFDYTLLIDEVYQDILDLKLERAEFRLIRAQMLEPDNCMSPLMGQTIDFLHIFISENESLLTNFKQLKKQRLKEIKQGPLSSPFYLYSQAQIHLQSALVRLKFKEYLGAFNEVSKAYDALEYNEKSFPDFSPNKISLGVLQAIVGSIPDKYKWGATLLGLEGSIAEGLQNMKDALSQDDYPFKIEGQIIYAFTLLHLAKNEDAAWRQINALDLNEESSLLAAFVKANIALRTHRNDEAIDILTRRPQGDDYPNFYFLDYMLGEALLYRLEPQSQEHLDVFVKNFRGKNYIKDAYRKMAWANLLFSDGKKLDSYKKKCQENGQTQVDADKSASKWANGKQQTHIGLLQARLLFDGGYYGRALKELSAMKKEHLTMSQQLEKIYREGRIHQEMRNKTLAIDRFNLVLSYEGQGQSYMIANAALQLGLIHEQSGHKGLAYQFFQRCLDMEVDEYANSLNQKAKAGMERVR